MKTTAHPDARLALTTKGETTTVDLYSPEGLAMVSDLWLKLSAEFKVMYEPTWMGVRIIQLPHDIVQVQELIWRLQPDVIVETGVAHGGSLIFSASLLELMGKGHVIGIDVEIRAHNRANIEAHPMKKRITLIEGSSIAAETVAQVKALTRDAKTVLVLLDSNHSAAHVAEEIKLYGPLVTEGSYLVVMDGAQGHVSDIPRGKAEWVQDNPLTAIRQFLATNPGFVMDPHYTRLHVTSNPEGYLRKLTSEEIAARGRAAAE